MLASTQIIDYNLTYIITSKNPQKFAEYGISVASHHHDI